MVTPVGALQQEGVGGNLFQGSKQDVENCYTGVRATYVPLPRSSLTGLLTVESSHALGLPHIHRP